MLQRSTHCFASQFLLRTSAEIHKELQLSAKLSCTYALNSIVALRLRQRGVAGQTLLLAIIALLGVGRRQRFFSALFFLRHCHRPLSLLPSSMLRGGLHESLELTGGRRLRDFCLSVATRARLDPTVGHRVRDVLVNMLTTIFAPIVQAGKKYFCARLVQWQDTCSVREPGSPDYLTEHRHSLTRAKLTSISLTPASSLPGAPLRSKQLSYPSCTPFTTDRQIATDT